MEQNNPSKNRVKSRLPAWDRGAALAATAGDENLAGELLEALLLGLPADLSRLKELLQARDWLGIDDAAHRMRGATAYCGAPALDRALEKLKEAARTTDEGRILRSLEQVELEAERLRAAVT